jgi:hypothetical protein
VNWIKAGLVTTAGFALFVLPPVVAAIATAEPDAGILLGILFDGGALVFVWFLAGVKMAFFPD